MGERAVIYCDDALDANDELHSFRFVTPAFKDIIKATTAPFVEKDILKKFSTET